MQPGHPTQRGLASAHHDHGFLEDAGEVDLVGLRSWRRRGRRTRTGRTGRGRRRAPCRPSGPAPTPARGRRGSPGPERGDEGPDHRPLARSRSRRPPGGGCRAAAAGRSARPHAAPPATRRGPPTREPRTPSTGWVRGSWTRNHSTSSRRDPSTDRTRHSWASKVCANRGAGVRPVLDGLPGQHPHPDLVHRAGRAHRADLRAGTRGRRPGRRGRW